MQLHPDTAQTEPASFTGKKGHKKTKGETQPFVYVARHKSLVLSLSVFNLYTYVGTGEI